MIWSAVPSVRASAHGKILEKVVMGPVRLERTTSRLSAGCTTDYATGPLNYLIRWDIDDNKGFGLPFLQKAGQPKIPVNESLRGGVMNRMGSEYYKHHLIEPLSRYGYTIHAGKRGDRPRLL
jgi:hypothetical protein